MENMTVAIYNIAGKEIDTLKLDSAVFDGVINTAAIYQTVNAYMANQRKGLASTKTLGEVSGGGRKPWKQKGTGRARAGSIRSPLWRHGGVTFGPHPRDFSYPVSARLKNLALKSALSSKVKEDNLIVLDNFSLDKVKTKEAAKLCAHPKINFKGKKKQKVLFLLDKLDDNLKRAFRNISCLQLGSAQNVNAYEVLACRKLVVTKNALEDLVKRLKK